VEALLSRIYEEGRARTAAEEAEFEALATLSPERS
jgi:hypothetical protein